MSKFDRIVIDGGVTAGGNANVFVERYPDETLKDGKPLPEGAKISSSQIEGVVKDSSGRWELLEDDEGPVKTSEGRYVYVPAKKEKKKKKKKKKKKNTEVARTRDGLAITGGVRADGDFSLGGRLK